MHLDIGLQVVEAHPLFPYILEKRLAIPSYIFFFYLLVNVFSVIIIIIIIINFFRQDFCILKRSQHHLYK